jgi:N-acetylglucosamine malate deacetylase 2
MQESCVVFCTDGGPRDSYFWHAYGSRENYVSVRRQEAEAATKIAGVKRAALLNFCDQELYRYLQPALKQLEDLTVEFRPDAILTHAYEGGHPDHDSCAFLAYLLGFRLKLPVWEMPLYHRTSKGMCVQRFLHPSGDAALIRARCGELDAKRQMVCVYRSQSQALQGFDLKFERFRRQASYDFSSPPETDVINYEAWQWQIRAKDVCAAFAGLVHEIYT